MNPKNGKSIIRVVVSDDHPIVRMGIKQHLQLAGDIEVIGEATDGIEAFEVAKTLLPDVLLLDMEMPKMGGIEVAKRLHHEAVQVKILALSAYDSPDFIQGILDTGAYGYLTKEELPQTIVQAVRGVAKGQRGWLSQRAKARMAALEEHNVVPNQLFAKISDREREVLTLIGQGFDNLTISELLSISERTVKNHASSIYTKMGFHTRAEAVAWTWKEGLVGDSRS